MTNTLTRYCALTAAVAALLLVSACGHAPVREATPGLSYTAMASWYGPDFHGQRTASGEVYDMDGLTAAHKTYPFGTRLRVTYPKTGDTAVVIVNDRGPFISGRDLDLSRGAARKIGMLADGVGEVYIEVLDRDMRYVKYVKSGSVGTPAAVPVSYEPGTTFRVQVGAFENPLNADRLARGLRLGYDDVRVQTAEVNGRVFHRVHVGLFDTREDAMDLAETLADEGYETLIFVDR